MKWWLVLILAIALASCEYDEVTEEIGYKGKARINPWLASEKFCEGYDWEVKSLHSWKVPGRDDALWFVPASILGNESYIRQVERWVLDGGHLVILVEHSEAETNDWQTKIQNALIAQPLSRMLERAGIYLDSGNSESDSSASGIDFNGRHYKVSADSRAHVRGGETKDPGVFASAFAGQGRMTVLTDARLLRNRWVDQMDHAALLEGILDATPYHGTVAFIRGSGLSFWGMLTRHLWPVLVGLGVVLILWLWKNLSRFGPVESGTGLSDPRGYDHHLEALGDYQWRLDKGAAMLAPIRAEIIERGQGIAARAGKRDDDFFQFLADRAGIPRERVNRALVEAAPPDAAIMTRTAADLQRLLNTLH